MPRHLVQYWKPKTVDWHDIETLNHTAGDQLSMARVGDTIWMVTIRDGRLFLLNRLRVSHKTDQKGAVRRLGNTDLWKAKFHVITNQPERFVVDLEISDLARSLRFQSATSDRFQLVKGRVMPQQLQKMRILTSESIRLLTQRWAGLLQDDGASANTLMAAAEQQLAEDLITVAKRKGIESTTKETLINARVGQGPFREDVLQLWGNCCAVTGSLTLDAIRASHIKPWRESTDDERLDPHNGLPLVASLDALFDAGLISFESSGKMVVSSKLRTAERHIFAIGKKSLTEKPTAKAAKYLAYHRANRFNK